MANIWDEYQQRIGRGGWTPPPGIEGQPTPPARTSGNDEWRKNHQQDPTSAAQATQPQSPQSYFPAVASAQLGPTQMPSAMMYPAYQSLGQYTGQNTVPAGGFGFGLGYKAPQMNFGNFLNQQPQQQPTVTGYHWYKGTGGVSGGNDANADLFLSNGTRQNMLGGLGDIPKIGSTIPEPQPKYPQAPKEYPITPEGNINFNIPGGSMQDALSKLGSTGSNYNSSTGSWFGY